MAECTCKACSLQRMVGKVIVVSIRFSDVKVQCAGVLTKEKGEFYSISNSGMPLSAFGTLINFPVSAVTEIVGDPLGIKIGDLPKRRH